ncbi:hypothetical protein [Aeromonas phage AerS_266]|nr:hypothetical protein [Aeromonas phage AerS_266]
MERIDKWVVYGILHGYPSCCIKAFSTCDVFAMQHYKSSAFTLNGTGFVPCDICNNRTSESLIAEINQNRLVNYKFPNQTKKYILQHNLIGYDIEDLENREEELNKLIIEILVNGLPDRYKDLAGIIYN